MSTEIRPIRRRQAALVYLGYLVAGLIFFGPVLFMLVSAFRDSIDITSRPFDFFTRMSFDNFANVFARFDLTRHIANSVLVAGASTLVGLVLGAPAAYVVVRLRWHGAAFLMLVARMAPGVMFVVPLFVLSVSIGAPSNTLLNYTLLIAAHVIITLPLCVWLLIPFFEAVPDSLEEASMIDGAGVVTRFLRIVLPLVMPGVGVALTLSFVFSWNYFLFALALSNNDTFPLTVIAFNFIGEGQSNYGGLMAATAVISAPALVLAVFAQRWLVRGIAGGAVK